MNKWSKELEAQLLENSDNGDKVFQLTKDFDECPEDWDGPCLCKLCRSYGD